MATIDDTPVPIGSNSCLVQNLGPDPLYVGESDTVTDETGIQIGVGMAVSLGATNSSFYLVTATGDESDARILSRGLGIFPAEVTPA